MTTQEVIEACINKKLEPYGITYDDVKKGTRVEFTDLYKYTEEEVPWYQQYTFNSKEEYESWREFCINLFRKELKMSKAKAEKEFNWFDLNYGLKQNYEIH